MRGAGLSFRFRLEEIQSDGRGLRRQASRGIKRIDKLPEPLFTPATKATTGHDINVSFEEMCKLVDPELSRQLRDLTLQYKKAADYALQRRIIIADTKFEFGQTAKGITLADEVLTPDSSRFWPADSYQPGKAQDSSTSSMYGITLKKFAGTNNHPRQPSPKKWRDGRAKSTSGHTVS